MTADTPAANPLFTIGRDYYQGLLSLWSCPREIWVAYAVKVLEGLSYFSAVLVLMIFLTEDMGLTDTQAGTFFGLWSALMSALMLFVGFVADSLGIKKALLLGLVVSLVGRVAITFTTNPYVVYPGLMIVSAGFAYMIPLIPAAVKLFTTKRAQKYAYAWYYVVMNVGSLVAGLALDPIRAAVTEPISIGLGVVTLVMQPTQVIFAVSVGATLVSLSLVGFLVRDRIPPEAFKEEAASAITVASDEATGEPPKRKPVWTIMKEVGGDKLFWVFIAFMFLLVLVKMIFQYNHSLYPLYMERIGFKEWTGKLYAINPAMIIILVPIMTSVTAKMNAYRVITLGCFISAGSVLLLGLGESIPLIIGFQIALSLGEALWSPRLYDYTASIAPPGKEASYMALSKVPMFFAKVLAGPITGILLANLCPEEGPRNTELMWILVGLSTLVSPIALLAGQRWLNVESRRQAESGPQAA